MALSKDCQDWIDKTSQEFMVPVAEFFAQGELELEDEDGNEYGAGWYARLSAPGYMDATEWSGPFGTEDEALEALYEMYGDDY